MIKPGVAAVNLEKTSESPGGKRSERERLVDASCEFLTAGDQPSR